MGTSQARIRAVGWCLVLGMSFAATEGARGETPQALEEPAGPRLMLDLAFFDSVDLSDRMKELIFREVEESFRPLAVEIGWVDRLREPERSSRTHEVRVLVLNQSPTDWGFEADVMGTIMGSDRAAVYVFYPVVVGNLRRYRRFLRPDQGPTTVGRDSDYVARALARVIVHELIHGLTPGLGHSRRGIMQRGLDTYDLGERPVRLDPAFRAALHQNLREAIAAARATTLEEPGSGPGG